MFYRRGIEDHLFSQCNQYENYSVVQRSPPLPDPLPRGIGIYTSLPRESERKLLSELT